MHGDTLYLLQPLQHASPAGPAGRLALGEPWSGPEGTLELVESQSDPAIDESWLTGGLDVRFRCGGERLKIAKGHHRRKLKKLLAGGSRRALDAATDPVAVPRRGARRRG